jgi:hypothetical protein
MSAARIAIVDSYYDEVLEQLFAAAPGLAEAPYAEQHRAVMALRFGTSDAYSTNLRAHGWDAQELVANCRPLQERWVAEHGSWAQRRLARRLSEQRVLREQIEASDCRVVYVQDFSRLPVDELERHRRAGRLLVGQLGSAPPWELVARYDLILTSFPHFVERVRDVGPDCEYFPLAFDSRVADEVPVPVAGRDVPVAFVGGVHGASVHRGGTALLERLCREVDLQMWGYIADQLEPSSPIPAHHHGPAWGRAMYEVLARARIVINRHGDIAESWANNMRLFEATGMGACLMTESARNLPGLFEPGTEVVTYDSADDLVAKCRALLAEPERIATIAAAGRARTLRDHTYATRMEQLDALLRERVGRG